MTEPINFPTVGSDSMSARYVQWLEQLAKNHAEQETPNADSVPFLSVLMRTQGKRYEPLKEALLALEAQTDDDFEVILIMHRAKEEDKQTTYALVDALSPAFRKRVTVRELETGTRSAPLNLALSLARGRYVTMLDDDDLVFEDWIENFHRGARKHDGRAIRCYAMTQFWQSITDGHSNVWLQAMATPEPTYCEPFDMQKQLWDNYTPISCMAIPRACHSVFGIAFDETLTTAEDWDFLMHCALLCGVYDTGEITFMYRLWQNGETSHTLHRNEEWLKNREYILKRLHAIPYVTTAGGAWPIPEEGEELPQMMPPLSFWQRLKRAVRKYGVLRFPFVVIRKVFDRLFGR